MQESEPSNDEPIRSAPGAAAASWEEYEKRGRVAGYEVQSADAQRQFFVAFLVAVGAIIGCGAIWYFAAQPDIAFGAGLMGLLVSIALLINAGISLITTNQCIGLEKQNLFLESQEKLSDELKQLRDALDRMENIADQVRDALDRG